MSARAVAVVVLALGALIAGCGGDDSGDEALSADDYSAQLNAACEQLRADSDDVLSSDDLQPDEIQQAIDDANAEFNATLADLSPPDEFAEPHQELVDLGDQAPAPDADVSEFVDYAQRNLDAFEAVAAQDCVDLEQQALDSLNEAG